MSASSQVAFKGERGKREKILCWAREEYIFQYPIMHCPAMISQPLIYIDCTALCPTKGLRRRQCKCFHRAPFWMLKAVYIISLSQARQFMFIFDINLCYTMILRRRPRKIRNLKYGGEKIKRGVKRPNYYPLMLVDCCQRLDTIKMCHSAKIMSEIFL
jgi:hypothetical protein